MNKHNDLHHRQDYASISSDVLSSICSLLLANADCRHMGSRLSSQSFYSIKKEIAALLDKYDIKLKPLTNDEPS